MSNNLFFDDDYIEKPKKENVVLLDEEKISEKEVLDKIYDKVNFKRKIKKSVFSELDKKILLNLSEFIVLKQMSYRVALDKLKLIYPDNLKLQSTRHETLRYYLIKHGFINNEKALKTINRSISNSGFAKNKRDRIIKDVIQDILENHLDKIIQHPLFEIKVKEIILNNKLN